MITSAVGQNLEYLQDNTSGLLIRPNDEKAFSEGLDLLLRSPKLRLRLGNAARKRIERVFNWSGEPLKQCLAAYQQARRYAA